MNVTNTNDAAPQGFAGEQDCRRFTSLSRAQRWRLIKAGEFPAPISISPGRTAWPWEDLVRWKEGRIAAARGTKNESL